MLNTTPRTWAAGETLTAALLNTEVRDALTGLQDAWDTFTPALTAATTNPVLGNGTVTARYTRAGKIVSFWVRYDFGSTTTFGSGQLRIALPVTAVSSMRFAFNGQFFDNSAGDTYPIFGYTTTTTYAALTQHGLTAGGPVRTLTGTSPVTMATSDIIWLNGVYEAA